MFFYFFGFVIYSQNQKKPQSLPIVGFCVTLDISLEFTQVLYRQPTKATKIVIKVCSFEEFIFHSMADSILFHKWCQQISNPNQAGQICLISILKGAPAARHPGNPSCPFIPQK